MDAAALPEEFRATLRDLTGIIRQQREGDVNGATEVIERLSRDEAHAMLLVATLLLADDAVVAVMQDRGTAHAAAE